MELARTIVEVTLVLIGTFKVGTWAMKEPNDGE